MFQIVENHSFVFQVFHDFNVYDGKSGKLITTLNLSYSVSETVAPVLVLDGNYLLLATSCHSLVRLINTRNGEQKSHLHIHGEIVGMACEVDDRTVHISTRDGRIMSLVIILELCDPVTMLIRRLPSRSLTQTVIE